MEILKEFENGFEKLTEEVTLRSYLCLNGVGVNSLFDKITEISGYTFCYNGYEDIPEEMRDIMAWCAANHINCNLEVIDED